MSRRTRPEWWALFTFILALAAVPFLTAPADAQEPCTEFPIEGTEFWAFGDWTLLELTLDDGRVLAYADVSTGEQFLAPEGASFIAANKCVGVLPTPIPEVTPSPTPVIPTPTATPETPSPTEVPQPTPTSPPESSPSPAPSSTPTATVEPTSTPDSSPSPTPTTETPTPTPEPTTTTTPTPQATPSVVCEPDETVIESQGIFYGCRPPAPDPCVIWPPDVLETLGIDRCELADTGPDGATRMLAFIGIALFITGLAIYGLSRTWES